MPGPTFWDLCIVSGVVFCFCATGGSSEPSVPWSPGVTPQKEQGGPWAPPPCGDKSSETLSDW